MIAPILVFEFILLLPFCFGDRVELNIPSIISELINFTRNEYGLENFSQFFPVEIFGFSANTQEDLFLSDNCSQEMQQFTAGLLKKELWAYKMLDASAKLQPGILYGNVFNFGNYEECLEVERNSRGDGNADKIYGQYCSATIRGTGANSTVKQEVEEYSLSRQNLMMTFGICVPSGCSVQDLQNISNHFSQNYAPTLEILFKKSLCSSALDDKEIPIRSILSIMIFSSIILWIGVGTFVDSRNLEGFPVYLTSFSLYSNAKKLFCSGTTSDSLGCLNGLRVLSMMLIVLGHRFIMSNGIPAVNRLYTEKMKEHWYNYIFIGLGFAVDTFFTISGILVVYLFMKTVDKGKEVRWTTFYLHRLLRLTPSMLVVVLFYATMLQFFENEMLPMIDPVFGESCRKYWWSTILYIQNYWNPNDMCAVHTWYLAIDTHLYILSPLILIGFKKFPTRSIICITTIVFLSAAAAFIVTISNHLGATYLNQNEDEYRILYTPTHMRVSPWLLGALTGYFISENKKSSFRLNKLTSISLWVSSLGILLGVLTIQRIFYGTGYNVVNSALFNALARPLWGLAICIIVMLCVFGYGGAINSFLSCSFFNVIIRINYAIYLIHMMVTVLIMSYTLKTPAYLSIFSIIHGTMGDYCLIVLLAIVWTLAFESPIIAIEKHYLSKGN